MINLFMALIVSVTTIECIKTERKNDSISPKQTSQDQIANYINFHYEIISPQYKPYNQTQFCINYSIQTILTHFTLQKLLNCISIIM